MWRPPERPGVMPPGVLALLGLELCASSILIEAGEAIKPDGDDRVLAANQLLADCDRLLEERLGLGVTS